MDRQDVLSKLVYKAGYRFGLAHPFTEFAKDKDSTRLMSHSPSYALADVFKYGVQAAWREKGELK